MSAGHQVKRYIARAVNIPASQTAAKAADFTINDDMRTNLKVDILVGKVAGTPSVLLQDSTGFGNWNTLKSVALTASTDQTVSSVNATTGVLTVAAHGYTQGQLITLNSSGTVPGGLLPGDRYFVANPTTNTFQLYLLEGNSVAQSSFTDAGSGTITVTAVQWATVALNVEVAGDQAVMPLRPMGRVAVTTGAGQTVQVVDVRVCHIY